MGSRTFLFWFGFGARFNLSSASKRNMLNSGLKTSQAHPREKFYLLEAIISTYMCKEKMNPVASSEGVEVYCPKNGRCSFFNSPYPMHCSFAGVDIYPERPFGNAAPSPIKGEVVKVRLLKCPPAKNFEGLEHDYLILLRSLENPRRWVKLLHVKPSVEVGDIVELGEELGILLRSGFFDPWTDPHIHVEVRSPLDPYRAMGGFKFKRCMEVDESEAVEDLSGVVVESKLEYSLVSLNKKFKSGVPVELNGQVGLLDAGIPHYKWFGIHLNNLPRLGEAVRLCGRKIGEVRLVYSNMCVAECCHTAFKLNGEPVRLSFYLYPSSSSVPLVKVIPYKSGELKLKKFEKTFLIIS